MVWDQNSEIWEFEVLTYVLTLSVPIWDFYNALYRRSLQMLLSKGGS